jgi:hypothetical protein
MQIQATTLPKMATAILNSEKAAKICQMGINLIDTTKQAILLKTATEKNK